MKFVAPSLEQRMYFVANFNKNRFPYPLGEQDFSCISVMYKKGFFVSISREENVLSRPCQPQENSISVKVMWQCNHHLEALAHMNTKVPADFKPCSFVHQL